MSGLRLNAGLENRVVVKRTTELEYSSDDYYSDNIEERYITPEVQNELVDNYEECLNGYRLLGIVGLEWFSDETEFNWHFGINYQHYLISPYKGGINNGGGLGLYFGCHYIFEGSSSKSGSVKTMY